MKTNKLFKIFRILILIFSFFVISVYGVNAVGTTPNSSLTELYYNFDGNSLDATPNNNDATNNGATLTTGIIKESYNFDGINDYMNNSYIGLSGANKGSICFWVNPDDISTQQFIYTGINSENQLSFMIFSDGNTYVNTDNNVNRFLFNTATYYSIGSYSHTCVVFNGSGVTNAQKLKVYVDNVLVSGTYQGTISSTIGAYTGAAYDNRITGTTGINGKLDEFAIFNYSLTPDEITYLYQTGTPTSDQQYPFGISGNPTLSFTNISVNGETFVNHSYLNTSNLDWYVEVLNTSTNGNVDIYYSLWNSTDKITDNEQIADNSLNTDNFKYNYTTFNNPQINIAGTDYYIYGAGGGSTNALRYCYDNNFNYLSSFSTSNSGDSIFATLSQPLIVNSDWITVEPSIARPRISQIICYNERNFSLSSLEDNDYNIQFYAENNETNVTSTNYTFTIDTTQPTINNNIPSEINSYILTLNSSCTDANLDYCNITINNQTTALNSTNITLTENGNLNYTITATDLAGNIITEEGVVLVNPMFYVYFTYINGTAITNFTINETLYENYFTGNIYDYGLGTHTFTFGKNGFVDTNFNLTFNTTSDINTTYNITSSSIFISIYDRVTGNLITDNVTIVLVATYGYNSTTTTGTFNITDIRFLDESYQVIATSDDYVSESVYFDFDNREVKEVNIYMLQSNLSNLGTHTIKAITDTGLLVNGAVCSALEWKPVLSAFVTVAQGLTDSNGETLLNVELGTKLYKFRCVKGSSSAESNNKIISSSGQTTTIQLAQTIVTPSNIFGDLTYTLTNQTLNSTHQRVIYTFTDGNGLVDIGCLKIYKVIGTKRTLLQPSCVSSNNGEIQLDQNINATYLVKAVASINIDGVVTELAYINFEIENSIENALQEYGLDIILPLIFLLLGLSLGFLVKPQNIYISLIGCVVMVWISVAIVPSVISATIASFITLICAIMLWGGFKFK